jgi:predicted Na+-dependent transporter
MRHSKKTNSTIQIIKNATCLVFPLLVFGLGFCAVFEGDLLSGILFLVWGGVMLVLIFYVARKDFMTRKKK